MDVKRLLRGVMAFAIAASDPEGGAEGFPLYSMTQAIRDMAGRDGARREVK
jgi:hypothetical protein